MKKKFVFFILHIPDPDYPALQIMGKFSTTTETSSVTKKGKMKQDYAIKKL